MSVVFENHINETELTAVRERVHFSLLLSPVSSAGSRHFSIRCCDIIAAGRLDSQCIGVSFLRELIYNDDNNNINVTHFSFVPLAVFTTTLVYGITYKVSIFSVPPTRSHSIAAGRYYTHT